MTHASTTDPDARLYRKSPGQGAKLCFIGHVLMENRGGLVVDAELTRATGYAERYAALEMIKGVTGEDGTTRRSGAWLASEVPSMKPCAAVHLGVVPISKEHKGPPLGHRRAHDAPPRLCRQQAHPQAD